MIIFPADWKSFTAFSAGTSVGTKGNTNVNIAVKCFSSVSSHFKCFYFEISNTLLFGCVHKV